MRLVTVLLSVTLACSAPAQGREPTTTPTPSPNPSVPRWTANPGHVFRATAGMPTATEPCRDDAQVEAMLVAFTTAFNSGSSDAIRATLSPEFWALSISVRGHHQVAYAREDAVQFVLSRQREGDQLEFRRVTVNGLVGWDGAAHIGPVAFVLRRGDATIALDGKGALYCAGDARGIKVLGLGG